MIKIKRISLGCALAASAAVSGAMAEPAATPESMALIAGQSPMVVAQGADEDFMEPDEGAPEDREPADAVTPPDSEGNDGDDSRADSGADAGEDTESDGDNGDVADRAACSGAKIVGGCAARKGAWKSFVVIHPSASTNHVSCGGSVIDKSWVLTAAHCISERDQEGREIVPLRATSPGAVLVREGLRRISGRKAKGGRVLKVAEVFMHPGYGDNRNDVALLRLASPLKAPRQTLVSRSGMGELVQPGKMATVVGFGTISAGGPSSTRLLQVDVPIVSEQKCRTTYPELTYADRLCAGLDQGGKDSCQGDSGGPLYARDRLKQPIQIGVVSYGKGCGDPNAWGVYASVGAFESWIRQYVPNAVFTRSDMGQVDGALQQFVETGGSQQPSQLGDVNVEVLPGNNVRIGEPLTIRVTSSITGKLIVLNQDQSGKTTQLFPNNFSSGTVAGRAKETVQAGETVVIPGPEDGFALKATPPAAQNSIIAIVAPADARLSDYTSTGRDLKPIPDTNKLLADIKRASDEADRARGVEVEGTEAGARAVGKRIFEIVN